MEDFNIEELVRQIVGVEDKAQEVMKAARRTEGELDSRVETGCKRLQGDIEKQMNERNDNIRKIEYDEAKKKIDAINAETEKSMLALEARYHRYKDEWVNRIFSGVIGE